MRQILDARGSSPLTRACLAALIAVLVLSLYATLPVSSAEYIEIEGRVTDELTGAPVEGANVDILRVGRWRRHTSGWENVDSLTTDSSGWFAARLEAGVQHRIIIYHEDGGFNYVPYGDHLNLDPSEASLDVELRRCAEVEVKGLAYFVETTAIPSTSMRVVDYETGETILSRGMSLTYGSLGESFTSYLGLPSDVLLVPSSTPFKINIRSTVGSSREAISKELEVDAFEGGIAIGEEAERFIAFLAEKLRDAQGGRELATRMIRVTVTMEPRGWEITFNYGTVYATMSDIYTKNTLTVEHGSDGTYHAALLCEGSVEGARATGSLMRRIGLDGGVERARDI